LYRPLARNVVKAVAIDGQSVIDKPGDAARAPRIRNSAVRPSPRPSILDVVRSRNSLLGPDTRPVELPGPAYDQQRVTKTGRVELPLHVRWSPPRLIYDLDDPTDVLRVYEQVLREGTTEDIQAFIDVDRLLELWDHLVLPNGVRRAWSRWYRDSRGISLRC